MLKTVGREVAREGAQAHGVDSVKRIHTPQRPADARPPRVQRAPGTRARAAPVVGGVCTHCGAVWCRFLGGLVPPERGVK